MLEPVSEIWRMTLLLRIITNRIKHLEPRSYLVNGPNECGILVERALFMVGKSFKRNFGNVMTQ